MLKRSFDSSAGRWMIVQSVNSSGSTKERILGAAEALFAQRGFDGASLRQLTAAAGVNLAAVNYHFGSKEKLVEQVFRRRLDALNAAPTGRAGQGRRQARDHAGRRAGRLHPARAGAVPRRQRLAVHARAGPRLRRARRHPAPVPVRELRPRHAPVHRRVRPPAAAAGASRSCTGASTWSPAR